MNKVKSFVAVACLLAISFVSNAQTAASLKIGYTNVEYILALMPESKRIESELKTHSTQLESQLQNMVKDFEAKGEAYQKGASTMTEVVRAAKEKELMSSRGAIEEFQKNAEVSLQKKQQTLLEPAYKKLQVAIDEVSKENGYTYVFNSDAGYGTNAILLHAPEDGNISDLVLKKMGITPPAKGTANATPAVNNTNTTSTAKPSAAPATNTKKKK